MKTWGRVVAVLAACAVVLSGCADRAEDCAASPGRRITASPPADGLPDGLVAVEIGDVLTALVVLDPATGARRLSIPLPRTTTGTPRATPSGPPDAAQYAKAQLGRAFAVSYFS